MSYKTRHEETFIAITLDECMNSITICAYCSSHHWAMIILKFLRSLETLCSTANCLIVNSDTVFNCKCDIFNTISMESLMYVHFLLRHIIIVIWGAESKHHTFSVFDDMSGNVSRTSFESLVGIEFEAESWGVPSSSLFGVTNPEMQVIVAKEFTTRWAFSLRFFSGLWHFYEYFVCVCFG